MAVSQQQSQKERLWIQGWNPSEHGWWLIGPADDGKAVEMAMHLSRLGFVVDTFISPLGKLSFYRYKTREERGE